MNSVGIRELVEAANKPREWVIEGLIERGNQIILAGAPKAGKSLLASQIAIAVAAGEPLFNWTVAAGRVLYVNFEMARAAFGRRLIKQVGGGKISTLDNLFCLDKFKSVDVMDKEEFSWLKAEIEEIQPCLIIFDVLARMHSEDEISQDMKFVMQEVRALAGGAAHIIVHHSRKLMAGAEGYVQTAADIRGSGAIVGEADLAMVLSKRSGNGARFALTFTSRNVEVNDMLLHRESETLNFKSADNDEADLLDKSIRDAFLESRSLSATALRQAVMNAFECGRSTAMKHIASAIKTQLIEKKGTTRGAFYNALF